MKATLRAIMTIVACVALIRAGGIAASLFPARLLTVANDCFGNGESACFDPNKFYCPSASCGRCGFNEYPAPGGIDYYYCACSGVPKVDPRDPSNGWECGLYIEVAGGLAFPDCAGSCPEGKNCTRVPALDPTGQGRTCFTCECIAPIPPGGGGGA